MMLTTGTYPLLILWSIWLKVDAAGCSPTTYGLIKKIYTCAHGTDLLQLSYLILYYKIFSSSEQCGLGPAMWSGL